MPSIEQMLQAGIEHHRTGNLAGAEKCYREVLKQHSDQADALHLLGLVFLQRGQPESAIESIRRAIVQYPRCAAYYNNLGEAFRATQRWQEATDAYQEAIARDTNYPDPWINLGILNQRTGELAQAELCYQQALKLAPTHPLVWLNLGTLRQERGEFPEARNAYRQALSADPCLQEAHNNLGTIAKEEGRFEDAERHYRDALAIASHYADAHYNLGVVLKHQGKLTESALELKAALQNKPDFDHALERMADVLHEFGDPRGARSCLERLGKLRPRDRLVELKSRLLCPTVFPDGPALEEYRAALDRTLDESLADPLHVPFENLLVSGCEPPFELQFHGKEELPTRRKFARVFAPSIPERPQARRTGSPKVGIVVTETHEAAFARSLLPLLNRFSVGSMRIEILCATSGRNRLSPAVRHPDIHVSPLPGKVGERPARIAAGDFDLLYYWEVGTDSQNYFLPFLGLAPVQCTSWGIQLTSGIPRMDIYLSNRWVEPADAIDQYSERLILGASMLSFQSRPSAAIPAENRRRWREQFGFRDRDHLYLCPHQLGKFHPEFDVILKEILELDPLGSLLVTADKSDQKNVQLAQRFKRVMPASSSRVHFIPRQAGADYYAMLASADVLLDPIHFGGVNTTYDALALGKPIVTSPSSYHRGRFTFGCFDRMGVLDCVAKERNDYGALAVRLATDADFRVDVSERVASASELLFDDPLAPKETEQFFLEWIHRSRESK